MKKLLILTAADGHYLDYAPLWEYCIKKNLPEAHCLCVEVTNKPCDFYSACIRLLKKPSQEYDYFYITDVDIMHTKESPTLLEYHLDQMKATGLSYSNSPRTTEPQGPQRLTGLHFATRDWYRETEEVREKYLHAIENGEFGNDRIHDELILMKVCKESGLEIPPPQPLVARHFGIHMGTIRAYNYKRHSRNKLSQQLRLRISPKQAKQWVEMYNDPKFEGIVRHVSKRNRVIKQELEKLYSFCRRSMDG